MNWKAKILPQFGYFCQRAATFYVIWMRVGQWIFRMIFFYIFLQVHNSSKSRQKKTPRRCHTTATKICWQHQVTRFGNLEITSEPQSELKTAIVYAPTLSLWSKNELILRRIMRKVCGHGLKDGTIWLKKVFTIISISCSFYYYLCSPLIVKYLGTNCSD